MKWPLVILLAFASLFSSVEKIAVVIGNNIGLPEETPLRFAGLDAQRFYKTLIELSGIKPVRTYLLVNKDIGMVEDLFKEVAGRAKEIKLQGNDVEFIVYFSGHGSDDAIHINGQKYPFQSLKDFFKGLDADLKILIVDACFSGALLDSKGGHSISNGTVRFNDDLDARGSIILTSSSAGEFSHESRDLQGSLFTHFLLSGMRGAADYDGDRKISLWECYQFARLNTLKEGIRTRDLQQNPGYDFDVRGKTNIILSNLDDGEAWLKLRGCPAGKYRILDLRTNEVICEANISVNDSLDLALPRNPYLIVHYSEKNIDIGKADLTWGGKTVIDGKGFKPFPLDVLARKGLSGVSYKPSAFHTGVQWMESTPTNGKSILLWELVYDYSNFNWDAELSLGFGKDSIGGDYFGIRRDHWQAGLTTRYNLINRSSWKVHSGIRWTFTDVKQSFFRDKESELRNAGYPALPTRWAYIHSVAAVLGTRLMLPYSLESGLEALPGTFLYDNGHGTTSSWFFVSLRFWIGVRF